MDARLHHYRSGYPAVSRGSLAAATAAVFAAFAGMFGSFPILTPYTLELGGTEASAADAISVYSLTNLPGNLVAGLLIGRWGRGSCGWGWRWSPDRSPVHPDRFGPGPHRVPGDPRLRGRVDRTRRLRPGRRLAAGGAAGAGDGPDGGAHRPVGGSSAAADRDHRFPPGPPVRLRGAGRHHRPDDGVGGGSVPRSSPKARGRPGSGGAAGRGGGARYGVWPRLGPRGPWEPDYGPAHAAGVARRFPLTLQSGRALLVPAGRGRAAGVWGVGCRGRRVGRAGRGGGGGHVRVPAGVGPTGRACGRRWCWPAWH